MADLTDIRIPTDLLPRDGRFGCGPAKVLPAALDALAATGTELLGTSHRQARVKDQVARLCAGLAELFSLPDGHEVVLVPGGATAFWEVAAFGLVERRARHYSFGEFSSKFAAATTAAPWLDDPDVVESPPGSHPPASAAADVDVQALTHNETSTGVMMPVTRPDADALVLVDATSGAGGLPVDAADADAYYFSLQKGFGSEGGLAIALLSPAAIERAERIDASDRYIPAYLSLTTAITNSRQQQTYNTPAIATVFLAAETTDWMNANGGLAGMVAASEAKAAHVYGWAAERAWATPFVADPDQRSLVVATIDLDDTVAADDVNAVLRANGILDTDGYRKLGRNQLRIGMFPAVDLADLQAYTASVDHVVAALA